MEKNEICVIYGKDYKEMTKKILRTSELAELIPSKDTLVGIKPNLLVRLLTERLPTRKSSQGFWSIFRRMVFKEW